MRVRFVFGLVLCAVGLVWLGQGIGWIGGSFMTGQSLWAVIGAIALLFGITLLRAARRAERPKDED